MHFSNKPFDGNPSIHCKNGGLHCEKGRWGQPHVIKVSLPGWTSQTDPHSECNCKQMLVWKLMPMATGPCWSTWIEWVQGLYRVAKGHAIRVPQCRLQQLLTSCRQDGAAARHVRCPIYRKLPVRPLWAEKDVPIVCFRYWHHWRMRCVPEESKAAGFTSLKLRGYTLSCLACITGHFAPIYQPLTGTSFQ
jgi:hypothetical protein